MGILPRCPCLILLSITISQAVGLLQKTTNVTIDAAEDYKYEDGVYYYEEIAANKSRDPESVIPTIYGILHELSVPEKMCQPNEFKCHDVSGSCIRESWRCDGQDDCTDGSDEKNCLNSSQTDLGCSSSEFMCQDGSKRCIRGSWRCDGEYDCMDGSDEKNCFTSISDFIQNGMKITNEIQQFDDLRYTADILRTPRVDERGRLLFGLLANLFSKGNRCNPACANGGRCNNGRCICASGFEGNSCSTRTCNPACANGGTCNNGQCSCAAGFEGDSCSTRTCNPQCVMGLCINQRCNCIAGFEGNTCSLRTCTPTCANGGTCNNGQCNCAGTGFTGTDCTTAEVCNPPCQNGGACINMQCNCAPGFTGTDCSKAEVCNPTCQNGGTCINMQCDCAATGFDGNDCTTARCNPECQNGGQCMLDVPPNLNSCFCPSPFTGPSCSTRVCPGCVAPTGFCDATTGNCLCMTGFTGVDCTTAV